MTKKDELIDHYFDWMYQLVANDRYSGKSYRKLISRLHSTEFTYTIPMDGNRAEDGIDLRYRFGQDEGYDDRMIASFLDDSPCSVLEMMTALAIRCEEHLMENPDIGDRTRQWFWEMLTSLGLSSMDDDHFDPRRADRVLRRFLDREYKPDGEGGLFTVSNDRDMRSAEIWYQMQYHLSELIKKGGL